MRIPPHKIDEVRSANDIVDVIGRYVELRQRGAKFWGRCPFHSEKTPSFTISADKQLYYCFGCHKGGNVITFIQEIEKMSLVEAVQFLAERTGIVLTPDPEYDRVKDENDRLFAAATFAARAFHDWLTTHPEGTFALNYLRSRGITNDTMRVFGLGYTLNAWDALLQKATTNGVSTDSLLKSGLIRAKEGAGTFYDTFRGRVMFPILNTEGKVTGFGARKIRDEDTIQGKYINSPETPIYNKSRILYGLSHAKDSIRTENSALMVEGYLDCISLFQAGITNVVASSGTALTPEQATLLGRYAKNVTLVYDSDSAGAQAAMRGTDVMLEKNLDVRIALLPKGDDPDSFVRKNGAAAMREIIANAVSFIDFKSAQLLQEGAMQGPELRAEAVRVLVQTIAKIPDPLKRAFFIKDISGKYGLYESDLYRELQRWAKNDPRRQPEPERTARVPVREQPLPALPLNRATRLPSDERDMLELLLGEDEDVRNLLLTHVTVEAFTHPAAKELYTSILHEIEEYGGFQPDYFASHLNDPALLSFVSDILAGRYELSKRWEKDIPQPDAKTRAKDILVQVKIKYLQREIDENIKALNAASLGGADKTSYLQRHKELSDRMKSLRSGQLFL